MSTAPTKVAVDRSSRATPLYVQVSDAFASAIHAGSYSPGDQLPSVPALSTELQVARATVIKAFDTLEEKNLIERRQGRGTFVASPPRLHSLFELTSFSTVTRLGGSTPGQQWISWSTVPDRSVAHIGIATSFPEGIPLVRLERVRFSDGNAVGHQVAVLDADLAVRADIGPHRRDDPHFSLYDSLAKIGAGPVKADESLQAVPCPEDIAPLLLINSGDPMMRIRRLSRDHSGMLVEAVEAHYIGSHYEYCTEITTQSNQQHERFRT